MAANLDVRTGPIHVEWFRGGRTNIAFNCLDRNVARGLGDQPCLIWEGNEPSACHLTCGRTAALDVMRAVRARTMSTQLLAGPESPHRRGRARVQRTRRC